MKKEILIVGETTLLIRCAELIVEANHNIVAICSPDKDVKSFCIRNHLKHHLSIHDVPQNIRYDYLLSIVNYEIIPKIYIANTNIFAFNYHDGPLPRYAGINVTSWSLLNHEKEHGVTWHILTEKVDSGGIVSQKYFKIYDEDNAFSLNMRSYEIAYNLFSQEIFDRLSTGNFNIHEQDLSKRTYYALNKGLPKGGLIDCWENTKDLIALSRATSIGE